VKFEKIYYQNIDYCISKLFIFLLYLDLVNISIVLGKLKKFFVMLLWMSVAGGSIIFLDSILSIPDEISGILYFISIGIAVSGTLNYYR